MGQGRYAQPKKKKKRGRKIFATIAFLLTVISCAAVICLALFFNITDISASGLVRYTSQEIIEASAIELEQNIFSIDSAGVERRIKGRFPYVDGVRVLRLLPTSVELRVTETRAAISVLGGPDRYTLLGENGRVLEQVEDVSTEGLPLVAGTDFTHLPVGTEVTQKALAALQKQAAENARKKLDPPPLLQETSEAHNQLTTVNYVLSAVRETGFEGLRYIDITDPFSVVVLVKDRVLVKLGTELELPYKLSFAQKVMEQLGEQFTGVVDVSLSSANQQAYTQERDIEPLLQGDYREGYY